MGAPDGSATGSGARAAAWHRPWHAPLVECLRSERAMWALQNAIGALFTALFTLVLDMNFGLACLCGMLYSASSLVLSLDRSVGGRMFGGVVFIGTVVGGASLGGGMVSLAWLARGDGEGLVDYLPAAYQQLPDMVTIQHIKDAIARLSSMPLPPALKAEVDRIIAWLSAELAQLLPPVSPAFWALLMALAPISFLPFCAARAQKDFGKGIIVAIWMVFHSSMFAFGALVPTLGLRLFWTEVVVGYIKVALAAAAGNVLAGTLVGVRSAHDDVRRSCGALLRGLGVRISRLGTAASASGSAASLGAPSTATLDPPTPAAEGQQGGEQAAVERYLHGIQAYVEAGTAECCSWGRHAAAGQQQQQNSHPAGTSKTDSHDQESSSEEPLHRHGHRPGWQSEGLPPLPAGAHESDFELVWAGMEISAKTIRLEPPLPLLCSQPGADAAEYAELERRIRGLQRAEAVLHRGQASCLHALRSEQGAQGAAAARLRAALGSVAAVSAAACAGAAEALAHMPALAPCAGPALRWRPLPAATWREARSALADEARQLAASYREAFQQQGRQFALSLNISEYRALLYALTAAAELLDCAQAAEAAAAAALEVPLPAEPIASEAAPEPAGANAAAVADGKACATEDGDVAADAKLDTAEQGQAGTCANGQATAKTAAAPRPSALKRLASNPYVANAAILLVLCSPVPAIALALAVRDPWVQYGLKYWLAMSVSSIVITAIMWKAIPEGPGPLQDANQQINFFVVWQPMYVTITVAICLQDSVEASLFRGILRSTMTVLGGALGYVIMLNGQLANNAFWVAAWVTAGNAAAGLLAPDRTLRYALFLAVFTYDGVILCQYVGCCDVAGDPKVFAGKVVSTVIGSTIALLMGWFVLPFYGSARMLRAQAEALQGALGLQKRMHAEVAAAAVEGRAVQTDGWLDAVEEQVEAPLASVAADLQLSVLDRRQMPLTWHLLPDPAVLGLLQRAGGRLADRLGSAVVALQRGDLFATTAPDGTIQPAGEEQGQVAGGGVVSTAVSPGAGKSGGGPEAAPPAVVPGPVFTRVVCQLEADVAALLSSLDGLVDACTANMTANAAGSDLKALRVAVEEAVGATQAARTHLHRRYLQEQPAALEAAGGHSDGDFACLAWLHAALRCVDEMVIAASMLLQEQAQDRDVLGGWVRAWRGQRAPPA